MNWTEAEALYISDAETSYGSLASKYGVAKSTILRHANKHDWRIKRKEHTVKLIKKTIEERDNDREVVDRRQVDALRATQAVLVRNIYEINKRSQSDGKIYASELYTLSRAMFMAMKQERDILGLPNVPKAHQAIEDLHGDVKTLKTMKFSDVKDAYIEKRRKKLKELRAAESKRIGHKYRSSSQT